MTNDKPTGEIRTDKDRQDEEELDGKESERESDVEATEAPDLIPEDELPRKGRLAKWAERLKRPAVLSRESKSEERTRGLVILAGTGVVCIFLFLGLFTTDSNTARKERRLTPNLGRPNAAATNEEAANRSPVPQLSVNEQPREEFGELSEQDVLGTMRNRGTSAPTANVPPQASLEPRPERTLGSIDFEDPALAEAYRRQGLVPPTQQPQVTEVREPPAQHVVPPTPAPTVDPSDGLRKSSIVYVRAAAQTNAAGTAPLPALARKTIPLLPQGTALVARLQHAVSSAAKVPVTAVIEYNYEDSGQPVVPAGTKAYGDLAQATPQGWVSINFHTLEFPTGEQEQINGSAISMERGVLRGDVNGKNSVKKFLTRAMTGVGTIAAFAVGGRGLTGSIDNSILLRERLASNIALAGEQELARLAYQQNIVVTVSANTRFYLILHEAGIRRAPDPVIQQGGQEPTAAEFQQASTRAALSDQEMRELIQLRNELREMNRLTQLSASKPELPASGIR